MSGAAPVSRPPAMTGQAVRTVGVAVAIPEPFGARLQAYRASFGDPMAFAIPTHITLLPPTGVPVRDRLHDDTGDDTGDATGALIATHLAAVAASTDPFSIHLRGTASFLPVSPVVFVPLVEGISQCQLLEQQVRRGPLTRDLAFPYHPHVTVAHDLPDEQLAQAFDVLAGFDCQFEVAELHLYEPGTDGVWRPEQTYPFGAPR